MRTNQITSVPSHEKQSQLMAAFRLPLRRLRRQIYRNAGHIIVGAFVIFAVVTLLRIDYAPPTAQFVQADLELPRPRTTGAKDAAVKGTAENNIAVKDTAIESISAKGTEVQWGRNAYVQYVASAEEVCKAVMLFSELHELFSNALRVIYYPSSWRLYEISRDSKADPQLKAVARLLKEASKEFSVILKPTDVLQEADNGPMKFAASLRKFLAFNLTQYDRVVVLDGDSIVLQSMDELFLLPPTPMALPYLYLPEEETWGLSTNLVVIQPSALDFKHIETFISTKHNENDILDLFDSRLLKLPQRPYHFLSEEFRQASHSAWLLDQETWDAASVRQKTKFISFWDPPMPGPWAATNEDLEKYMPQCAASQVVRVGVYRWRPVSDCSNRIAWARLYRDFANRRRIVCGVGFV